MLYIILLAEEGYPDIIQVESDSGWQGGEPCRVAMEVVQHKDVVLAHVMD